MYICVYIYIYTHILCVYNIEALAGPSRENGNPCGVLRLLRLLLLDTDPRHDLGGQCYNIIWYDILYYYDITCYDILYYIAKHYCTII